MKHKFEPIYIQEEKRNISDLKTNENCINLFNEISNIRSFMDSYSFLQFGRSIVFLQNTTIPPFDISLIMNSIQQTLGSFEACCRLGNFSDAYTLLRKYRDDLFFYLYIILISKEQPKEDDILVQNLKAWLKNELCNLYISDILKYIGLSKSLAYTIKKYNLQKTFINLGVKLNNFTHANGHSFYNKPFFHYKIKNEQQNLCKDLSEILNYITTTFVLLSAVCNPISIMSTDYTDYLDCNIIPPPDSQYWVAPFIIKFLEQRKSLIDINCIKYLQDNTGMQLLEK